MSQALVTIAKQMNVNQEEAQAIINRTLLAAKGNQPTNEEVITFLAIASEYQLNPLTREIYAFSNRGTIQPIVSIDGWLKIINQHPQFDGMEFEDHTSEGDLIAVTCKVYRKDRSRPTEVTEYMSECKGGSDPWKRWPNRMLRHKATIQAARYAFGLSGIIDPDEAERIKSTEKDMGKAEVVHKEKPSYPDEQLEKNLPQWQQIIASGRHDAEHIIKMISTRHALTEQQENQIRALEQIEVIEQEA